MKLTDLNKEVPKGEVENLPFRDFILEIAALDEDAQDALRVACREDILFWINVFVWQFNPQHKGREVGPFITWDFQDWAIIGREGPHAHEWGIMECIECNCKEFPRTHGHTLRIEKSREMGATWLCLLVQIHACLFKPRQKFLLISRDEDSVDRPDDPDSLMWKIDFVLEHLPDWMTGRVRTRKMGRFFESTSSSINGEASTGKAGVGGRATAVFIDEFSQIKEDKEVFDRTADTAECRIFNFTHKGTDTMAYALCYETKYSGMRSLKMHWSQHPEKKRGLYYYDQEHKKLRTLDALFGYEPGYEFDMTGAPMGGPYPGLRSPWYDNQCRNVRSERGVAMDLDIDPRGATDQFFDGYRIGLLKIKYAIAPIWVGNLDYDKNTGADAKLIRTDKGLIRMWVSPVSDREMPKIKASGGIDVAAGSGRTPSCVSLFNCKTGEKFLEYSNATIYPNDLAVFVYALCMMIRDQLGTVPKICWEKQGPPSFNRKIVNMGYPNYYVTEDDDVPGRKRDPKNRAGFNASQRGNLALMEDYKDSIYKEVVINKSWFALDECLNFVYSGQGVEYKVKGKADIGTPQSGASVHHGDIVKADAMGVKMLMLMGQLEKLIIEEEEKETIFSMEGRMAYHGRMEEEEAGWDW